MISKKESVLEAAKELFAEHGYIQTTFAMIAKKAGVALGLLAHHYGNKEKLFLAAGLDVLDRLLERLSEAVAGSPDGMTAIVRFAHAYLHFSLDPSGHFLVLIRCSPYSDVKTSEDRAVMVEKFEAVLRLQEACVARGMADGSIKRGNAQLTTQAVQCCLVGAVRTMHLTPYSVPGLFDEVEEFIRSALTPGVTSVPCIARNLP